MLADNVLSPKTSSLVLEGTIESTSFSNGILVFTAVGEFPEEASVIFVGVGVFVGVGALVGVDVGTEVNVGEGIISEELFVDPFEGVEKITHSFDPSVFLPAD